MILNKPPIPGLPKWVLLLLPLFLWACNDDVLDSLPFINASTGGSAPLDIDQVEIRGQITDITDSDQIRGQGVIFRYGFIYSNSQSDPQLNDPLSTVVESPSPLNANYEFTATLKNLNLKPPLYYRAFCTLANDRNPTPRVSLGVVRTINLSGNLQIGMLETVNINNDEAEITGVVLRSLRNNQVAQSPISDHGFVFDTVRKRPDPLIDVEKTISKGPDPDDGNFSDTLTGLAFNQPYFVWAYSLVNGEYCFSDSIAFETLDGWHRIKGLIPDYLPLEPPIFLAIEDTIYCGFGCSPNCNGGDEFFFQELFEITIEQDTFHYQFKRQTPIGRRGGVSFVLRDTIYYGLGESNGNFLNEFRRYAPGDADWTAIGTFPDTFPLRKDALGFTIGNRAFLSTGIPEQGLTFLQDTWEYDPLDDTWDRLESELPTSIDGVISDESGRHSATALLFDNKVFVAAGRAISTPLNDVWQLDNTSASPEWKSITPVSFTPRKRAISFTIGGTAYFGMGEGSVSSSKFYDFWAFSSDGNWSERTSFPEQDWTIVGGTSIGQRGYIAVLTRRDNVAPGLEIWEYIPRKQP